jgi:hypothetical protein
MLLGLLSSAPAGLPDVPQGDLLAASLTVLIIAVLLFLLVQLQVLRLAKRIKKLEDPKAGPSTPPAQPKAAASDS